MYSLPHLAILVLIVLMHIGSGAAKEDTNAEPECKDLANEDVCHRIDCNNADQAKFCEKTCGYCGCKDTSPALCQSDGLKCWKSDHRIECRKTCNICGCEDSAGTPFCNATVNTNSCDRDAELRAMCSLTCNKCEHCPEGWILAPTMGCFKPTDGTNWFSARYKCRSLNRRAGLPVFRGQRDFAAFVGILAKNLTGVGLDSKIWLGGDYNFAENYWQVDQRCEMPWLDWVYEKNEPPSGYQALIKVAGMPAMWVQPRNENAEVVCHIPFYEVCAY